MTIEIENDGPVRIIAIDRFDQARNAVNPETADALYTAFMDFNTDASAKVAVFTGLGGAFCGGWDQGARKMCREIRGRSD